MLTNGQQARAAEYAELKKDCPARQRLAVLFDDGEYTETNAGCKAGVITAYGFINGSPVYAFSQDITDKGGAVSTAHSGKICRMLELAARNGVPVVGIYDSKGAFISDGAGALNAYSDIMLSLANLSGVVPVVSIIAGVCAGSMAVLAASADYSVMTEKAELYVTAGADSSAKKAAETGAAADTAGDDKAAAEKVRGYLTLMPANNLSAVPEFEYDAPSSAVYDTAENAAAAIADEGSLKELYSSFGKAAYTALCTVGGASAGIAATCRTGDKLTADDMAKIARFVRLCDAFGIPVITVVDSEGAELSGAEAVRAYSRLAGAYAEAVCPKIALVSGKAYGGIFTALAGRNVSADAVLALPQAVIAPVAPETAAEFLYHDKLKGASDLAAERKKIASEYAEKEASAFDAAAKGAVDDVVNEAEVRSRIISALEISAGKRLNKRLPKKHSVLPV